MYTEKPHVGRGGWTWYTGSAGWMYRAGLEAILGLRRERDQLVIHPCLPPEWHRVSVRYEFGRAVYEIAIEADCVIPRRVGRVLVDGVALPDDRLPLRDDGGTHVVVVEMVSVAGRRPGS